MLEPTLSSRLAAREKPKDAESIMTQQWRDILFLHWAYDPNEIQKTLPKGLYVDTYKGNAYVGVTPFFIKDVKLKMMPFLPGLSNFMQVNVRTYVYDEFGVPGVWFYSLDANNFMVVQTAKSFFNLPYFYSDMESETNEDKEIVYRCQRRESDQQAEFCYKGIQNTVEALNESLEFFLTERYILFVNEGDDKFSRGRIHHTPYPLQKVTVSKWDPSLMVLDGLQRPQKSPDHILFSSGVDVEIFPLKEI